MKIAEDHHHHPMAVETHLPLPENADEAAPIDKVNNFQNKQIK